MPSDNNDNEAMSRGPVDAAPSTPESADPFDDTLSEDEIPVPEAMSAAEIDERAQAVEAMRGKPLPARDDEPRMDA